MSTIARQPAGQAGPDAPQAAGAEERVTLLVLAAIWWAWADAHARVQAGA